MVNKPFPFSPQNPLIGTGFDGPVAVDLGDNGVEWSWTNLLEIAVTWK